MRPVQGRARRFPDYWPKFKAKPKFIISGKFIKCWSEIYEHFRKRIYRFSEQKISESPFWKIRINFSLKIIIKSLSSHKFAVLVTQKPQRGGTSFGNQKFGRHLAKGLDLPWIIILADALGLASSAISGFTRVRAALRNSWFIYAVSWP